MSHEKVVYNALNTKASLISTAGDTFDLLPPSIDAKSPITITKQPHEYFPNYNEIPIGDPNQIYLFEFNTIKILAGEKVTLQVEIESDQEVLFTWYCNGIKRSSSQTVEFTMSDDNVGDWSCTIQSISDIVQTDAVSVELINRTIDLQPNLFTEFNAIHPDFIQRYYGNSNWMVGDKSINTFEFTDGPNSDKSGLQNNIDVETNISRNMDIPNDGKYALEWGCCFPHPTSIGLTLDPTYYTRDKIFNMRDGGNRYSMGYYNIDFRPWQSHNKRLIKGISDVTLLCFVYIGVGVSAVDSDIIFEDQTSLVIQFMDRDTVLLERSVNNIDAQTFKSYFTQTARIYDYIGSSIIIGNKLLINNIPVNTTDIRLVCNFKHDSDRQTDDFSSNRYSSILAMNPPETKSNAAKLYGTPRCLMTGVYAGLYYNEIQETILSW